MTEPKVHSKYEIDPNYDKEKHLSEAIADVRVFLEKELACIDSIDDITMQAICLFSMLDCLAQEQANYPSDSKAAFFQFVLKHQKQCNYMECVEPITLYYHIEELIEKAELYPGFPPEKVVSLEDLGYLYGVTVETILPKGKSEEILAYIEKQKGTPFAEKKAKEHQLISLLYRMRSKAVHEMSGLGEIWHDKGHNLPAVPYYRDVGRSYVLDGNWVYDNVAELVIPNCFLRSILLDCIDGYLEDCKTEMRFPFSNNHMNRKPRLSWYDR